MKKFLTCFSLLVLLIAGNTQAASIANSRYGSSIDDNPSLLAENRISSFRFGFNNTNFGEDNFLGEDSGFNSLDWKNYGFQVKLGHLGFSYFRDGYNTDLETYKLGFGSEIKYGLYSGYAWRWYSSNLDPEFEISLTFRPINNFSLAYKIDNISEENKKDATQTLGLAYRPFYNENLTLFSDFITASYDYESSDFTFKVGAEAEPFNGLFVNAFYQDALDDENYSSKIGLGARVELGRSALGSKSVINDDQGRTDFYNYLEVTNSKQHDLFPMKEDSKVVKIILEGIYKEETSNNFFANMFGNKERTISNLIRNIDKLSYDPDVKGIVLETKNYQMSFAAREELRKSLERFKENDKKVIAYFVTSSQMNYYLVSVADKIYTMPVGGVEMPGLYLEMTFFKNLLDKIGVKMQVFKHGKYKSAMEQFTEEKMTPANKEQLSEMLQSLDKHFKEKIASGRNISVADLNTLMDKEIYHFGKFAVERGLVDGLLYQDKLDSLVLADVLNEKLEDEKENNSVITESLNKAKKGRIQSLKDYLEIDDYNYNWEPFNKKEIAIIYATGGITSGKSSSGGIMGGNTNMGSETMVKLIRNARKNSKTKAIVLRVDSPGGSGIASDEILRELRLAQTENELPVIVSMGGVAASGGYYISCFADRIFANEETVTGSIGVFGGAPSLDSLYSKLGITHDRIKTNKYSNLNGGGYLNMHDISEDERNHHQFFTDEFYDGFISLVAEGRKMDKAAVDKIAQGRVWTGKDALKIGLVDEIGGLKEAVAYAREKTGFSSDDEIVNNFCYKVYTPGKTFLLKSLQNSIYSMLLPDNLKDKLEFVNKAFDSLEALESDKIQAKLPYDFEIK